MHTDIHEVLENIRNLQEQLEIAFDEAREKFHCTLEDGRVRIAGEVRDFQRKYRVSSFRYLLSADLASILTAPVIYAMIIPLLIIDASFTLYQHVCFRVYGIPRVRRFACLVNDRHKLEYLNNIEKLNCTYCGYANGVDGYIREILSRTEQYWCPIRHAYRVPGAHRRYPKFFTYGDAQGYQLGMRAKRDELRSIVTRHPRDGGVG
jgi:hypothetical protein